MAATYSKIYIHVVFSVKYRKNMLQKPWRQEVFRFISHIIKKHGHKAFIVNGVHDHIHILLGLHPNQKLSDLIKLIKTNSTILIQKNNWANERNFWQEGYAAFSISQKHVQSVYRYIEKQEEHHKTKTFNEEYSSWLDEYLIEYKKNIFQNLSNNHLLPHQLNQLF